jgi:hypothetical protein
MTEKPAIDLVGVPPPSEIRIRPSSLTGFATTLRTDFTRDVGPTSERVQVAFANGAAVGYRNPSDDLRTMISSHRLCVDAMSEQLVAYTTAADVLITAAHTIVARYGEADALAATHAAAVADALSAAAVSMSPPSTPPPPAMRATP